MISNLMNIPTAKQLELDLNISRIELEQKIEDCSTERASLFSVLDKLPALVYIVAPDYTIR